MAGIIGAKKQKLGRLRDILPPVAFFVALVLFLLWGTGTVSTSLESEQQKAAEQAIRRTVAQCYALEGQYPQNLSYLSEHYGLTIDQDKYVVHYRPLGGNLMPEISVFPIAPQPAK